MDSEFTDKLIKDFLFLWATIDPIGTLALFASVTVHFYPGAPQEHRAKSHTLLWSNPHLQYHLRAVTPLLHGNSIDIASIQRRNYPLFIRLTDDL